MGNSTSSPGVEQAMQAVHQKKKNSKKTVSRKSSALDKGSNHSRKSGLDKGASHSKRSHYSCKSSASDDLIDEFEMEDVIDLLQELNRNDQGKELLVEYIDYQTGKSKRKPKLLELVEESSMSHDDLPITEITIGSTVR